MKCPCCGRKLPEAAKVVTSAVALPDALRAVAHNLTVWAQVVERKVSK